MKPRPSWGTTSRDDGTSALTGDLTLVPRVGYLARSAGSIIPDPCAIISEDAMAPGSRLQELTAKYMQNPRRFFVPLANEYRLAGDLDRAIALCREHLPAQPGHMSGHIVLGRAYFEKGDHGAARDVFLTSVALDDENLIALRHLGDLARLRADVPDARSWYARVLDADPENREIEQLLRSLDTVTASVAVPPPGEVDVTRGVGGDGEQSSGLADPTPPGLRAIVGDETVLPFDAELVRIPAMGLPTALRPLATMDLSSLGAAADTELDIGLPPTLGDASWTEQVADDDGGITAMDGGGFGLIDLDELVDPATGDSLPGVLPLLAEADFNAGITTPTESPMDPSADEFLSSPVFGALASFASWRTAQERDTPRMSPVVGSTASASDHADDGPGDEPQPLEAAVDAAGTAPEFVTETMAALYLQQGFTRQALDVYRALLERTPGDVVLTMKVMELQLLVDRPTTDAALEDDADKALQFGEFRDPSSSRVDIGSVLEARADDSPVAPPDPVDEAFGRNWRPEAAAELIVEDDWFAEVAIPDEFESAAEASFGVFGLTDTGLGARIGDDSEPPVSATSGGSARELASVFGTSVVAAADESAAEMLVAMAGQMVGRLPKEPPTLPVPDVLELPSGTAADEKAGTSAAPLLSFDRFFSGSGSPPRQRVDTPSRPATPTASRATDSIPVVASPSLSPTFGGVPVIPPSQGVSAPTWAGFDQFLPPSAPPGPAIPATPVRSTPSGAFWTPAVVPAIPSAPASTPTEPAAGPMATPAVPDPDPPVVELPVNAVGSPPESLTPESPTSEPPRPESTEETPPSDFHRWLQGLS